MQKKFTEKSFKLKTFAHSNKSKNSPFLLFFVNNLFRIVFVKLFQQIRTQHQIFGVFYTHIEYFNKIFLHFFLTLKSNSD
jgi:hypothetical protein